MLFKEVTPEDVSMMKSPANYEELCKLAVAYSDGVIQNDETVNQNVLDYARSLNIPVLEYASGDAMQMRVTHSMTRYSFPNKYEYIKKDENET